jgi:hypothetical protein
MAEKTDSVKEDAIVSKSKSKSERLSKDDLQFLMGLLDKAEEEIETEGDGYRQDKGSTLSTRRRIIRIKSALINFEGNRNS